VRVCALQRPNPAAIREQVDRDAPRKAALNPFNDELEIQKQIYHSAFVFPSDLLISIVGSKHRPTASLITKLDLIMG
jgi:hypothetical protein